MFEAIISSVLVELPARILLAVGFYLALRILRFPDLTVEATFVAGGVGAAIGAVQLSSAAAGAVAAIVIAGFGGAATGLLYRLRRTSLFKLLASVLVVFSFYSIHFRILGGKSQQSFNTTGTIFNTLADLEVALGWGVIRPITAVVGAVIAFVILFLLFRFLNTQAGILLRSVGYRPDLSDSLGVKTGWYTVLGLVVANMIIGVGGWLHYSIAGSVNINVFGTVIHALAAVILGEIIVTLGANLFGAKAFGPGTVFQLLAPPVLGAVAYINIRAFAIWFLSDQTGGDPAVVEMVRPEDLNLLFALVLIGVIIIARSFGTPSVLLWSGEASDAL